MIQAIFDGIGSAVTSFTTTLGNALSGVVDIFYNSTDGLTPVGSLLLISVGIGLVYFAYRVIRNLVKTRG